MTLDKACSGQRFQVLSIDDRNISNQVIRLGICKGAELTCAGKLPGGPIIIQNKMQEIAIGRRLAKIAIRLYSYRSTHNRFDSATGNYTI